MCGPGKGSAPRAPKFPDVSFIRKRRRQPCMACHGPGWNRGKWLSGATRKLRDARDRSKIGQPTVIEMKRRSLTITEFPKFQRPRPIPVRLLTLAETSSTAAFAATAKDLRSLRDTVVDAAGVGAGLWFSYLFLLLYPAIAAGSVTHRDLLFESPVKLPFLGVDLPMIGFFILGPLLFVIVHVYVLLHIGLLARKVRAFHEQLRTISDDETRTWLRLQLPSNIFVQFLAGPIDIRTGFTGALLRSIAWISLTIGPVVLLLFFILQFLPYHSQLVSWWQRLVLTADLASLSDTLARDNSR